MTHTTAADMVEDGFPHGTKEGFELGCRGRYCPAGAQHGLSCQRAKSLAAGDYQYQKLLRGGATPAAIADALGLVPAPTAEVSATVERPALPTEPVPAVAEPRPAKWAVRHAWVAFAPDGTMHGPFDDHGEAIGYVGEQLRPPAPKSKAAKRPMSTEELGKLRELHTEGLSDTAIAKKLGRVQPVVSSWRRRLGLESNGKSGGAKVASS